MPSARGVASLNDILRSVIPALAELYDKFTYSLDPHSDECDQAEKQFNAEMANLCQVFQIRDRVAFRRAIIFLCKKYLKSGEFPGEFRFNEPQD